MMFFASTDINTDTHYLADSDPDIPVLQNYKCFGSTDNSTIVKFHIM